MSFCMINMKVHNLENEDSCFVSGIFQVTNGLSWLRKYCPSQPELHSTGLLDYVEDFLTNEVFTPLYQDLAHRRHTGLLDQVDCCSFCALILAGDVNFVMATVGPQ